MTGAAKHRYAAPAAACAADVMLALARGAAPMTVADLARDAGYSKSLVYRVVHELEARQYLARAPGGAYWLDLSVVELGGAFSAAVPLITSIRRVLRALADDTGETVNLGILRGADVLYLAREEGERSIFAVSHVGKRLPANCVAIGKVLLAARSADDVARRFAAGRPAGSGRLRALTASSIDTPEALAAELERVRERGYAEEHGESVPGRCCAAIKVTLPAGQELAISVSMDEARHAEQGGDIVARLRDAREQIERDSAGRASIGEPPSLAGILVEEPT